MFKFIYVFDKTKADSLIASGLRMVKSDAEKNIYVFENIPSKTMNFSKKEFVFSDTLTF